jgi:zinc transport system substrate-binding protein
MKPYRFTWALLLAAILFAHNGMAASVSPSAPNVVASILPVHALASLVMAGVAEPSLLLRPGTSPHDYAMRPSDASLLQRAGVVFWIGPDLETFLVRPIAAYQARTVPLIESPGLQRLALRAESAWGDHPQAQIPGDTGAAIAIDPHVWLSLSNAGVIGQHMARVLSQLDPEHAAVYRSNARTLDERLRRLHEDLAASLRPVRDRPYVVFHDAYQYLEREFDLHPVGSLVLHPEIGAGARHLQEIQQQLVASGVGCVFTEPQFDARLAERMLQGTGARVGVLDPLGSGLAPGPGAYEALMRGLVAALVDCLSDQPVRLGAVPLSFDARQC